MVSRFPHRNAGNYRCSLGAGLVSAKRLAVRRTFSEDHQFVNSSQSTSATEGESKLLAAVAATPKLKLCDLTYGHSPPDGSVDEPAAAISILSAR